MDGLHKEIPKNKRHVQCEGLNYHPFARPSKFINLIVGFYSHDKVAGRSKFGNVDRSFIIYI
jgi:hypothetical protein